MRSERSQTAWSARRAPDAGAAPGTTRPSASTRVDAVLAPPPQVVPSDAEQEAAGDGERAEDGVREGDERGVVGEALPRRRSFAGRPLTNSTPTGCCIQRVGDDDEDTPRRPNRSPRDPRRRGGSSLGQPFPAEDPEAQEGGFDEEREQAPPWRAARRRHRRRSGEYSLQAMPNWNSWTMPVATPMMKLIRKSFPQNLVIRRYSDLAGAVPSSSG